MEKHNKRPYYILFWICGWNNAIFSYCVVCFTPLFLISSHFSALNSLTHASRIALLGYILAIKPLTEVAISYPLAKLIHTTNVKSILQLSIICSIVSILGFIVAYSYNYLSLMFFSQILFGLGSLNIIPIKLICCYPSQSTKRTKYFNFMEFSAGIGMLAGPILGGLLAGFFFNTFLPQIPFFLSAGIGLCLFLIISKVQLPSSDSNKTFHSAPPHHKKLSSYPINLYLLAWFLFMLGWQGYFHWFPALMVSRFHFSHHELTTLFTFMGLIYASIQLLIIKPLTHIKKQKIVLYFSLPTVALTIGSFALVSHLSGVYILLSIYMVAISLVLPFWQSIISFCGAKTSELFGSITLLTGLSSLLVTSLGSVLAAWSITATFLLWGGLIILSFIITLAASKTIKTMPVESKILS